MGEREEHMFDGGYLSCPAWCAQPDDEHQTGAHQGDPRVITDLDGNQALVSAWAEWPTWNNDDPSGNRVCIDIVFHAKTSGLIFGRETLDVFLQAVEDTRDELDNFEDWQEAYEGSAADADSED